MALTDLLIEWTAINEARAGKRLSLNPASDSEIATVETKCELRFHDELRELLTYTSGIQSYRYFPGGTFAMKYAYNMADVGELMDETLGVPDVGRNSALLMIEADIEVGIVCEGPTKGALWRWNVDGGTWVARSLSEFVTSCIQYEENGYLNWEIHPGRGAMIPEPQLGDKLWSGPLPRNLELQGHAWRWEPIDLS